MINTFWDWKCPQSFQLKLLFLLSKENQCEARRGAQREANLFWLRLIQSTTLGHWILWVDEQGRETRSKAPDHLQKLDPWAVSFCITSQQFVRVTRQVCLTAELLAAAGWLDWPTWPVDRNAGGVRHLSLPCQHLHFNWNYYQLLMTFHMLSSQNDRCHPISMCGAQPVSCESTQSWVSKKFHPK